MMLENWEQRSYREEPDVDRRPFCEHCKSIVLYGDDLTETPEGNWLCEECLELYQEEWGDNLKRLIWNAKMVAKRLHTLENRSAEAWAIRELLNYISEHDVTRYMEIELKIKREENK